MDVRVKTKEGKHIDIEIQILPTEFMAERTLFYWSKMYNSQISSGDTYDKLKKCVAINIVDFERIEVKRVHTKFHIIEDETGYKLTDVLEIHFLEVPKLKRLEEMEDTEDPIIEWLEFINAKSKEVMEMLAERNENIKNAYNILQRISQNKEARMAYEAREAEIMDQLTREKVAKEEGREEGREEGIKSAIKKMLVRGMDSETVASILDVPLEMVKGVEH